MSDSTHAARSSSRKTMSLEARPLPERSKAMATDIKYEIILYWSPQDLALHRRGPELPGCAADGATYQEAVANVEVVIQEWIETARELGRPIPVPQGRFCVCLILCDGQVDSSGNRSSLTNSVLRRQRLKYEWQSPG